jgi:hypothetical protein
MFLNKCTRALGGAQQANKGAKKKQNQKKTENKKQGPKKKLRQSTKHKAQSFCGKPAIS